MNFETWSMQNLPEVTNELQNLKIDIAAVRKTKKKEKGEKT